MLEKSVAQVNTFFMDHNLMVGVINVGSFIFKAKLIIPMLYFDTSQCRVSDFLNCLPTIPSESLQGQRVQLLTGSTLQDNLL